MDLHVRSPRCAAAGQWQDVLVPSALTNISRRRALFSAAALALLGASAAACGTTPPPPELADLTAQLDRARADSKLAADAAAALPPQAPAARALTAVADERSAHAQALSDELTRMTGELPASTTAAPTSASPAPTADPDQAPSVDDVVDALEQSAKSATDLAPRLSGYRAGLVGSIAASCTAAHTVALGGAR
ncbi:hypothetical protein [Mycolicibacterium wolinskyi]|uniref:hypothetical protein n=1 Tax=Mycolicibacterium wolinskyi TaxID=59750 RepID=UPI003917822F